MKKDNILIATHSLDIGGCETYVLIMAKALIEKGYGVSIVANDGIYRETLKKIGANVHILDFYNRSNSLKNIEVIENIIKEDDIKHVSVQPFFPFFDAVVASIKQDIPYSLFFHGVSLKGYFDIRDCFSGLGVWSNIFIENIAIKYAKAFVYVSEEVKQFYEKEFNLDKNKGILLKNSIRIYENIKPIEKIEKFAILTRIDKEKLNSIKTGIEFYKILYDKSHINASLSLDIIGAGNAEEDLNNFIKEYKLKYNIKILPATNDTNETINKYDAIIGMGRSLIEAMSLKKIVILTNYSEYVGIIKDDNDLIEEIAYANFSGRNMSAKHIGEDVEYILSLSKSQIINIVEKNYEFIKTNNDINKNILDYINIIHKENLLHITAKEKVKEYVHLSQHIHLLEKKLLSNKLEYESSKNILQEETELLKRNIKEYEKENIIQKEIIENYKKANKEQEEIIENYKSVSKEQEDKINSYEEINKKQENEISQYKDMLNNIYNKKAYILYKKLKKIINKKH